jgi:hypothetical protein
LGVSFGVVAAILVIVAVGVMYFGRKYYFLSGASVDSMIEALCDDVKVQVEVNDSQATDKNAEKKIERGWKWSILLKIIITAMQIVSQCPVKFNLPLLPLFSYLWLSVLS